MIVYKTPSRSIFQNRQQFHAAQKTNDESTSDWFKRLQQIIGICEFETIAEYMLIDKFVSGLSNSDFEKISQVLSWSLEELVLLVLGNSHVFKTNANKVEQHTDDMQGTVQFQLAFDSDHIVKTEFIESNIDQDDQQAEADNSSLLDGSESNRDPTKTYVSKSQRNKNHIQNLKNAGKYDEYKRKKAVAAKTRRQKAKSNEQYLPPELQLHLMNERRRITRERVQRWRERKRPKPIEGIEIFVVQPSVESAEQKHEPHEYEICEIEEDNYVYETAEEDRSATEDDVPDQEAQGILKPKEETHELGEGKVVEKRKSSYVRKRKEFECYVCQYKCRRMYELKTHLSIFHPMEKKELLTCPHCPKTTRSRDILSRHLKKCHAELLMHKCHCCPEQFAKKGQLNAHHLAMHPDYRPYICETCGNGYRTLNELNSHMRKHTGIKPHKCDICNMFFVTKASHRNHLLIHTGEKPFPCKLCDKFFRQVSSLRKHMITIHNQGEKSHLCTTCNKRFSSIYHLRIHVNVHTGDRPYRCNYCGQTFSQPSALKMHTGRIHENAPPVKRHTKQNTLQ